MCEGITTGKPRPFGPEYEIFLSGTRVREMLAECKRPAMEFTCPEVADGLTKEAKSAG